MTKGELRNIIKMTIQELTSELRSTQAQIEVHQLELKQLSKSRQRAYNKIRTQQVKYNFLLKEIQRKQEE